MLHKQFIGHYTDLLNAIKDMNYESLEQLCEETLTKEIAAKVYEQSKFNGIQFRVLNSGAAVEEVDILNHFHVNGMSINREDNPGLHEYRMITRGNVLDYVAKLDFDEHQEETQFFQSESRLDHLLALKKYYQIEGATESPFADTKIDENERLDKAIMERAKFDKLQYLQNQTKKALAEVLK